MHPSKCRIYGCTCDWMTLVHSSKCMSCGALSNAETREQNAKPHDTLFLKKEKVRKVMCWRWKISVFHWCQLAIHSHDNAHVLDSDSSYTWMIMRWWVWASVCHETSMTEWWEWKRAWSRPAPPHYTSTNLSSLDVNENNRDYSEMDAPFVNPGIPKTLSYNFTILMTHIHLSSYPW